MHAITAEPWEAGAHDTASNARSQEMATTKAYDEWVVLVGPGDECLLRQNPSIPRCHCKRQLQGIRGTSVTFGSWALTMSPGALNPDHQHRSRQRRFPIYTARGVPRLMFPCRGPPNVFIQQLSPTQLRAQPPLHPCGQLVSTSTVESIQNMAPASANTCSSGLGISAV